MPSEIRRLELVDQTLFGDKNGDCFGACVATITGLPLAEIPNFCVLHSDDTWYVEFANWLGTRGLSPHTSLLADEKAANNHLDWARLIAPNTPWIACGESERENGARPKHAVVYIGDRFVHDPNPRWGRSGILRIEDATYFNATCEMVPAAERRTHVRSAR